MSAIDKVHIGNIDYEIVPEIAPLFSTSTAYSIGDCVIKDAVLYRFTSAHAAGAWNASHVEAITVGEELSDLKSDLGNVRSTLNGFSPYKSENLFDWDNTIDAYITTDGVEHPSGSYIGTDFIEVTENDIITFYVFDYDLTNFRRVAINVRYVAAYDANKNPVPASGSSASALSYTVPAGIKFVRCSIATTYVSSYSSKLYITKNNTPTSYYAGFAPKITTHAQAGNHYYQSKYDAALYNETLELPTMSLCKNEVIVLNGYVSAINALNTFKIAIGQGSDHFGASWIDIDKENIYWHLYTSSMSTYTYAHSLPFSTVSTGPIRISIVVNNNTKATLKISYGEAEYSKTLGFYGFSDQPYFISTEGITISKAVFSVTCKDFDAPVFAFGDSYMAIIEGTNKWTHWLADEGFDSAFCINAFPGADSAELANAFANTLAIATPQKILWCLGMNDGNDTDASTPNTQWMTHVNTMISMCEQRNIEPLFLTIPTVPTVNGMGYNEGKNNWIRKSKYRFADAAMAVGADGTGTWYSGMLGTDNVHPTELGAKAIFYRIMADLPDLFV